MVVTLLAVVAGASPSAAQTPGPSAAVDRDPIATGEVVRVTGSGWSPGSLVRVELCGNEALDATADCAIGGSRDVGVLDDGNFFAVLPVLAPPSPCPCVVRVSGITAGDAVRVPVTVLGVPVAPPEQRIEVPSVSRALEVTEAEVTGGGPWTSWLGAPAERTLHLTVRNTGNVAILDPRLQVTVGRGDEPAGLVDVPDLGRIEAGESRSIEVPVELDALSFGSYNVLARLGGGAEPVEARTGTSTYPWVLIAGAIVLAQLVLLSIRNRVRARVAVPEPAPEPRREAIAAPEPEPSVSTEGSTMFRSRKATSVAPEAGNDELAAFVADLQAPEVAEEPAEPQPTAPAKRAEAAVLAGSYLQDAIEESRALRAAAAEDRRLAAVELAQVQSRCDALLAGAEQIVLERATEVQARSEEAVALLQDAQRRADELILAATITVEEAKQAAERHRAEAAEMLARTAHLGDELLAEARIRVEELLGGVDRRATETLLGPSAPTAEPVPVEAAPVVDLTEEVDAVEASHEQTPFATTE